MPKTYNLKLTAVYAVIFMLLPLSCSDRMPEFVPAGANGGLSDVYLDGSNAAKGREPILIRGRGFKDTDKVCFISEDGNEYVAETYEVTESGLKVIISPRMKGGLYKGRLDRADGSSLMLGHTNIYWVLDANVPDKEGMTVKGTVSCDGKGLEGVVVSDGFEVTVTDEYGFYWLPSAKKNGYVFISLPSGYFPASSSGMEGIFRRVTLSANETEQLDFTLVEEHNDDCVVILMADAHLADRGSGSNNDMAQFRNKFVPDVNATVREYREQGRKVYGITLGDLTWDTFWYETNYRLGDAMKDFAKIDIPMFHCMGNHDNDIRALSDFDASEPWRQTVGPNYYSFNLGKAHYIVLDDIEYTTDGSENKTENANIESGQMEWLRKDLATVTDKNTPIMVCMHIPLHGHPGRSETGELISKRQLLNADEFINAFSGFTKVRLLTGHTHVNYNIPVNENMIEHNIGGVCATWWWTGKYYDTHICRDGSVGGFGVLEWKGTDYNRYWKSLGHDRNYQFRAYDRNNVWITAQEYAPDQDPDNPDFLSNYAYLAQDYAWQHNDNEVIINVFSWEDSWKIEVTENGKQLPVRVTNWFDPLHIISFDMFRLNKSNDGLAGSPMKTSATSHLFRVNASSPTSTLEIKMTDCYGNVYTETMVRPKTFDFFIN